MRSCATHCLTLISLQASKQHESPQTDSLLQESITARFSYVAGASASNGNTASLAANGCKSGGTLAQAQELCNADSACTVLHDYNGDGAGWRACEKVTSGTGATTMVKVASEDDTTMDEGTSDCDVAFSNWQELCESTNDASCASSLQDLKQNCPNHSQVQAATAATQATGFCHQTSTSKLPPLLAPSLPRSLSCDRGSYRGPYRVLRTSHWNQWP